MLKPAEEARRSETRGESRGISAAHFLPFFARGGRATLSANSQWSKRTFVEFPQPNRRRAYGIMDAAV